MMQAAARRFGRQVPAQRRHSVAFRNFRSVQTTPARRRFPQQAALSTSLLLLTAGISIVHCAEQQPSQEELEQEWDDFLLKAIQPGEDDDDEEEEDDEDDDDDEEVLDETQAADVEENQEEPGPADESEDSNADAIVEDDTMEEESLEQEEGPAPVEALEEPISEDPTEEPGPADADEDDDEYASLPDEDEPTTCTICLINRQGPCRPYWRKFERCMKDYPSKKDGMDDVSPAASGSLTQECDKYMLPWLTCVQQHRHVYTLITNQLYQKEYVDVLEASLVKQPMVETPKMDWTEWMDFVRKNDLSVLQLVREMLDTARWKQEQVQIQNTWEDEPELVEARTLVSLRDPETKHMIEIAYVRDQDGTLLGFDQFTSDEKEGKEEAAMTFHILPGDTREVQVYTLYKEEAKEEKQEGYTPEERLYCSQPISLLRAAKQAIDEK